MDNHSSFIQTDLSELTCGIITGKTIVIYTYSSKTQNHQMAECLNNPVNSPDTALLFAGLNDTRDVPTTTELTSWQGKQ